MAPIVWPKDPKGQLKILKKFFRGKTKIPATCTTKDGNLTVLRQDKKSKIGVSKQKKCPKTRSTPKTPKPQNPRVYFIFLFNDMKILNI